MYSWATRDQSNLSKATPNDPHSEAEPGSFGTSVSECLTDLAIIMHSMQPEKIKSEHSVSLNPTSIANVGHRRLEIWTVTFKLIVFSVISSLLLV